ncbi:MAG: T9SS type A sorting domain-containing protein [Flavipsychrobacter sp.]|nr:T9SS type A sorting domain-containing protein [Flavipsychrobacter sp.]
MKFEAPNGVNITNSIATSISVFPNPSTGIFIINISSMLIEDAAVTITNATGEQVKKLTLPTNKETSVQLHVPPLS